MVSFSGRRGDGPGMLRAAILLAVAEKFDDVLERSQSAQMFRLDGRSVGQSFLKQGEDLDALDRVDAQVGVELHVQLQQLGRVTGLGGNHVQQRGLHAAIADGLSCRATWATGATGSG